MKASRILESRSYLVKKAEEELSVKPSEVMGYSLPWSKWSDAIKIINLMENWGTFQRSTLCDEGLTNSILLL